MRITNPTIQPKRLRVAIVLLVLCLVTTDLVRAATAVSGDVSGTWTTNGSPYVLIAECTVPTNQVLTIDPGVTVIVGPDVNVLVYGSLKAVGAPDKRIQIRGATPTNYWNSIIVYSGSFTNEFRDCRISEAANFAIGFNVEGSNQTLTAEVANCEFTSCPGSGLFGATVGIDSSSRPTLNVNVRNCIFRSVGNGSAFSSWGVGSGATVNVTFANNIFDNVSGTAFVLQGSTDSNNSRALFINNTVVNAKWGVMTDPPFDTTIHNNVFYGCSNAVQRRGSASLDVKYNCFFGNAANFVGYPGIYGIVVTTNQNSAPSDIFNNIFLDPQFVDRSRFLLGNASPCIDAGDPAVIDACFSFSKGTATSDIGAYGGPDACHWPREAFEPVIIEQPLNLTSCIGADVAFRISADGAEPLSYQWYFNRTNVLTGQTSSNLSLVNLDTNQAGNYSVVLSNAFGNAASDPARLLVFDACVGVNMYAGLSITGIVGRTYCVQYATNIAATNNWIPLATNTLSMPYWLFIDTESPFQPGRFYRVNLKP